MLAIVFGAGGSGKSTQAPLLRRLLAETGVHDFDDVGDIPWDDDWRRHARDEFRACQRERDAGRLPLSGRWWDD